MFGHGTVRVDFYEEVHEAAVTYDKRVTTCWGVLKGYEDILSSLTGVYGLMTGFSASGALNFVIMAASFISNCLLSDRKPIGYTHKQRPSR